MNIEGTLLLAYLYLAQKEYVQAVQYLQQILRADILSEVSSSILYNFLHIQDKNPSACAISLKAFYLLRSAGRWETLQEEKLLIQELSKKFILYREKISNVDRAVILSDEESAFCTNFFRIEHSVEDFFQNWKKEQSLANLNFPLAEWRMLCLSDRNFDSKPISSFFEKSCIRETANFCKTVYQEACTSKSIEERARISTRLHFRSIDLCITGTQLVQLLQFSLKYPELAPPLDVELEQLLKNYKEKYEEEQRNPRLVLQLPTKDPILNYKGLKPLQRFLTSSQVKIKEPLVLLDIALEDRCFALSQLADKYFIGQAKEESSISQNEFSLPALEKKEDYRQATEQQLKEFYEDLKIGSRINQSSREFRLKKLEISNLLVALQKFLRPNILQS